MFKAFSLLGVVIVAAIFAGLVSHGGLPNTDVGRNFANHMWLIGFLGVAVLLWRPIFWAARLFLEGFFLGEGVKRSGVLRDLYTRRGRR